MLTLDSRGVFGSANNSYLHFVPRVLHFSAIHYTRQGRHVFYDWMVKEGGISLLDEFFRLQVKCHSDS